ncbi:hypothetical protein AVEN_274589-1 [Araneus ventricosus]|uniref:Uncharacterized protein n=1 Tax=Araneus ventricosus TaxID=182803 RepID=A0A4Y2RQ05_ARAVE|nr:hypothetical protein AVEN_274589-1 [Araneus ventricosus]
MNKLDGETTGPKTFSDKLMGAKPTCAIIRAYTFTWASEMKNTKELSTDQKYLFDICAAVSTGLCPPELQNRKPGPITQSRWITTPCRILLLYVSTTKLKEALRNLEQYVVRVYAPVWFNVKKRPGLADGPRHLWKIVQLSTFLPNKLKEPAHAVIQTNAYYGHPENLLLAMANEENQDIRTLTWKIIKKCHNSKKKEISRVQEFKVPNLNFRATEYYDCIDWFSTDISEPPITKNLSSE